MEIVKYLCEFFFCDGWHYIMLLLLVAVSRAVPQVNNYIRNKKEG